MSVIKTTALVQMKYYFIRDTVIHDLKNLLKGKDNQKISDDRYDRVFAA